MPNGTVSKVYYSTNGGTSFLTATGTPQAYIPSVALGTGGKAYLATMDLNGPPVYCSTDNGAHWQACSTGLTSGRFGRVVKADPINPDIAYLGTDLGIFRAGTSGIWIPFGSGLPLCPVNDLEISPDGLRFRIATYGCGAWELVQSAATPPGPVPPPPAQPAVNACGGTGPLLIPGAGSGGKGSPCYCNDAALTQGVLVCSPAKTLVCCPCHSAPWCGPGAPALQPP
jgi:hypothetical protein